MASETKQHNCANCHMMSKRGLLLLNGILWTFAAYKILGKGLPALYADHRWWVVALLSVIGIGFFMMFRKVSENYSRRIIEMEGERFPFYRFMSLKGYCLIAFMMTLGIAAARIPGMPQAFFSSFYTALGSGLASGAVRYFIKAAKL